ncbi:MAG: 16S rRNA (cytosine(1402)-N(4))-methyltransferase RsmH [Candidatus Peregrinibacteria bacterium]|nr:16S rRNA (cytosine(1402)-N(4))-methyltransferase RsmH [Candidatus Peregrinibacteria bacterium]
MVHIPVLLAEGELTAPAEALRASPIMTHLSPRGGESVIDTTLGLGGHAEAFLTLTAPDGVLIGLDADVENLDRASKKLSIFGERFRGVHANFRALADLSLPLSDILFADLGLSSPHLDEAERGFTFREDAPLDMRYDRSTGRTAATFLARASEEEILKALREFGELQGSARIAHILCTRAHRTNDPLETTGQLRQCIEEVFGFRAPRILPQVFQALRIAVNDELQSLQMFLGATALQLKPGGRLGIISYHSLEDRMVKQAFRAWSTPQRDAVTGAESVEAPFRLLTSRAVQPSDAEVERNPRARSARFRAVQRSS